MTTPPTQLPVEKFNLIDKEAINYFIAAPLVSSYIAYRAGATAYATKLHGAQQEIENLKRWKEDAKSLLAIVHKGWGDDTISYSLLTEIKNFLDGK